MHMCFHACKGICRDQKRELDSLELELQVVASHQAWVLGTGAWNWAWILYEGLRALN